MNWFEKIIPPKIKVSAGQIRRGVPEGVWSKCESCQAVLYAEELTRSLSVCPKCDFHIRMTANDRLVALLGEDFTPIGEEVQPVDALKFKDKKRYKDRLADARKNNQSTEALVCAHGLLGDQTPVTVAVFDFKFLGGSMGSVVGERFVRAAKYSLDNNLPFICFSASGGARMQEALFSLMQMAKTTAAIAKLKEQCIPFISVLTDPTMGGVSASLAMLGDLIIAEPNALVGFAGPRVIEQTVRETLPDGFQRAEFLLQHGAIDMIVDRREMQQSLIQSLALLGFGPSGSAASA